MRSESSDDHPVLVTLNGRWRVIACRHGIQWILQYRNRAETVARDVWRGRSYCHQKRANRRMASARRCASAHQEQAPVCTDLQTVSPLGGSASRWFDTVIFHHHSPPCFGTFQTRPSETHADRGNLMRLGRGHAVGLYAPLIDAEPSRQERALARVLDEMSLKRISRCYKKIGSRARGCCRALHRRIASRPGRKLGNACG